MLRRKGTESFKKYNSHNRSDKIIVTEHVHEDSDVSFRKRGKMDARKGIFILIMIYGSKLRMQLFFW